MKSDYKALSIKQPWAWLIVHGGKDIENRTWNTKLRGRFLVHAGKSPDKEAMKRFVQDRNKMESQGFINPDDLKYGGIIGSVEIVDVVEKSDSKWFQGPYGFVLQNPEPLDFVPLKGQLNFFTAGFRGNDEK